MYDGIAMTILSFVFVAGSILLGGGAVYLIKHDIK
ncbi:hypothetical protein SAMN05518855_1001172 [Paenibacillus sp. CF384]|nr:hypothetical protein SAMN05518855_1001172 [Paenibacillus sp. CF384]